MSRARIHPGERTEVKRILRDLAREGTLRRDAKRFALPGAATPRHRGGGRGARAPGPAAPARAPPGGGSDGVLGTLKKHRDGFGFVARLDRKGDDVFLPPGEAARALDGDLGPGRDRPGPRRAHRGPAGRGGGARGAGSSSAPTTPGGRQSFVVPVDAELAEQVPVPETRPRPRRRGGQGGARPRQRAARGARWWRPSDVPASRGWRCCGWPTRRGFGDVFPGRGLRRGGADAGPRAGRGPGRAPRPHRAAARHHRRRGRPRLRRRGPRGAARGGEGPGRLPAGGRHRRRGPLRPARVDARRRGRPPRHQRLLPGAGPAHAAGAALQRHLLAQPRGGPALHGGRPDRGRPGPADVGRGVPGR